MQKHAFSSSLFLSFTFSIENASESEEISFEIHYIIGRETCIPRHLFHGLLKTKQNNGLIASTCFPRVQS